MKLRFFSNQIIKRVQKNHFGLCIDIDQGHWFGMFIGSDHACILGVSFFIATFRLSFWRLRNTVAAKILNDKVEESKMLRAIAKRHEEKRRMGLLK